MVGGQTMKQVYFRISAVALIAAMCFPACQKVEFSEEPSPEQTDTEVPAGKGWTVAIDATMGSDTKALAEDPATHKLLATFETTDAIYVYNKTKNKMDANPLHPDQNGASAVLTGTLAESYDAGDELVLCYKCNSYGNFQYSKGQKGTLSTVADYAQAGITISAEDAAVKQITGSAAFVNMQSIFGFNFSSGGIAVPARVVEISTEAGELVSLVRASPTSYQLPVSHGITTVVADAPISGTLYAGLSNDNTGDDMYYFRVNDGAGHLYTGSKAASAGKIVNGKYYASSVALTPIALPTVTLTASGTPVGPNAPWDETLTMYGWSDAFLGYANYEDLTISGNTAGCWFIWCTYDHSGGDRTITLDGATVTRPEMDTWPFCNQEGTFTVVLNGDNSISTTIGPGIDFTGGESHTIWFKGNGTLTITCETPSDGGTGFNIMYGIHDRSTISSTQHPSPQAADGYTLTISDGTDNGDGTTTWVYTVAPEVTVEMVDLGLPSGTLWAKYNLGVDDPTVDPYGNYYAWGETSKRGGAHTFGTYQLGNGTNKYTCLTKYIIDDGYTYAAGIDGKTQLEPADDAATVALGSAYSIPTAEDWMELWNGQYVTFSWSYITCVNPDLPDLYPNVNTKVYGVLVRSKSNGNTIFLPAAERWGESTSISQVTRGKTDSDCYYWSSTLYAFPNSYPVSFEAYCFKEDSMFSYYEPAVNGSNPLTLNSMPHDARCYGMPVRPVKHK